MRVFLKGDDDISMVSQCLCDTAVEVEFDANHSIRADNFSNMLRQVTFAIVITVCNHCAMQAE